MDSIISRNRRWRIELCDDVCGGVQPGCGEGGEHTSLIPLEVVYEKLQRTISFAMRFRFDSFLQRWKALDWFYNFGYFNVYHMLRCNENVIAIAAYSEVVLAALATFLFGNSNL